VTTGALRLYGGAMRTAAPLAPWLLRRRALRGKEDPRRLNERLGRPQLPRPLGRLVWLHGASVGETLSILPLIEALLAADQGLNLLVTSGTVASADLLAQRLPPRATHQYLPIDTPSAAQGFVAYWRPDLAVFVESEIWPNLLAAARGAGVRTALVSARLSAKSLKGWSRLSGAARALIGGFDLVLAQDAATALALSTLGARDDGRLNLKLVGAPLPADPAALEAARAAVGHRPILLAASTHPGEDDQVLEVFTWLKDRPDRPLLVLVPRHILRGADIAEAAVIQGFNVARRAAGEAPGPAAEVYVADTLGELGVWFRLARLALICGSLRPRIGGHNPLEASRLGCPAASGGYVENWRGVYAALQDERAVRMIGGAADLAGVLAEALTDASAFRQEAARAKAFAGRQGGAVATACAQLMALLGHAP
jgi:3-deoxy-D-manno-octulosonic-acid transferase